MFFNQKGKINSFINLKLNRSPLFNNSTTKKVYISSALPPLDFIHKLSSLVLQTRAFILQKRPLVNITLFAISFIKYSQIILRCSWMQSPLCHLLKVLIFRAFRYIDYIKQNCIFFTPTRFQQLGKIRWRERSVGCGLQLFMVFFNT